MEQFFYYNMNVLQICDVSRILLESHILQTHMGIDNITLTKARKISPKEKETVFSLTQRAYNNRQDKRNRI